MDSFSRSRKKEEIDSNHYVFHSESNMIRYIVALYKYLLSESWLEFFMTVVEKLLVMAPLEGNPLYSAAVTIHMEGWNWSLKYFF